MNCLLFALILIPSFGVIGIDGTADDDFQLFDQCDQTVGTGIATCMQYFSPFKFVTDFLSGDKESLCCTHFRHTACIRGVRDAVRLAKAANLCPDSISEDLITTLTDSTIDNYIRKSCKTLNTAKCVMDSVGDVVNTIQGFFNPQQQQQKPVLTQIIDTVPQLINSRRSDGNTYAVDDTFKSSDSYNGDRTSLLNPFREIIRDTVRSVATERPAIGKASVRDLYDRQYIPEASDVEPSKKVLDKTQTTDPLSSLFRGLIEPKGEGQKKGSEKGSEKGTEIESIFENFGNIFGSDNSKNKSKKEQNFFSDIFNDNQNNNQTIVKDFI